MNRQYSKPAALQAIYAKVAWMKRHSQLGGAFEVPVVGTHRSEAHRNAEAAGDLRRRSLPAGR
jgi:hypothetical protein